MLLRVVGSCCAQFEAGQTFEPTTYLQYFFCSMISRAWCNNVESVCTALPTLLAIFGLTNPSGLVAINFTNQIINFIIQETVIKYC